MTLAERLLNGETLTDEETLEAVSGLVVVCIDQLNRIAELEQENGLLRLNNEKTKQNVETDC